MAYFLEIDELTIKDHYYLTAGEDLCYFMKTYTAHKGFSHSATNSLISNLKKTLDKKGTAQFAYKEAAISEVAEMWKDSFKDSALNLITFVPVPPSKNKKHLLYDNRMLQILEKAFGKKGDIRELVEQINSTEAVHKSEERLKPEELQANLKINENLVDGTRSVIYIADDVITTGAHFIAMKRLLKTKFPNAKINGIFICRREIEAVDDDDF